MHAQLGGKDKQTQLKQQEARIQQLTFQLEDSRLKLSVAESALATSKKGAQKPQANQGKKSSSPDKGSNSDAAALVAARRSITTGILFSPTLHVLYDL